MSNNSRPATDGQRHPAPDKRRRHSARGNQPRHPAPDKQHSARLGRDPIYKLLWRLSLPAAVAMGVNAVYNLADTLFVGRGVGGLAVGAIAISFPIAIMQISFGLVLGVGGGSLLSRALGAGKRRRAGEVLGAVMIAQACLAMIFTTIAYATLSPLLRAIGATDEILPLAIEYSQVIVLGSVLNMHNLMFANLIRAEGRIMWSTLMFVVGALLNIALDALFIFVWDFGVRGAAIATVISQLLSCSVALIFYFTHQSEARPRLPRFTHGCRLLSTVCALGVGSGLRQWGEVTILITANNLLRRFGGSAEISAYGIVHRIVLFSLLPIVGVAQALIPIVGYNWGAKQYQRARAALRLGNRVSFMVGLPIALAEAALAMTLCGLFVADPHIRDIGATALRIIAFGIPLIPVQLNCANYFQTIGEGGKTIMIHGARQFLLIVVLILLLGHLFGIGGIWWAFIIGDTFATTLALLLFWHQSRKQGDPRHGAALR